MPEEAVRAAIAKIRVALDELETAYGGGQGSEPEGSVGEAGIAPTPSTPTPAPAAPPVPFPGEFENRRY